MVWPAIIAAGAALAGGALQKRSADKAANQQMDIANMNVDLQKEFAQQGIRWKVEDAKAAGIHPLAALGAQTTSFSPVSIMSDPSSGLGQGLAQMGQNISEAWARQATADERSIATYKVEQERLKMEQLDLQNQGLRRELNTMNQTPAFPSGNVPATADNPFGLVGQGDASYGSSGSPGMGYQFKQNEIPYSTDPGISAGVNPATDAHIYPQEDAPIANYPNERLSESLESGSFVDRWKHNAIQMQSAFKNAKNFVFDKSPKAAAWREWLRENRPAVEPGFIALWDPWMQTWRRVKSYEGDTRLFYDVAPSKQRYSIYGNG